jgi:hypothetical protein
MASVYCAGAPLYTAPTELTGFFSDIDFYRSGNVADPAVWTPVHDGSAPIVENLAIDAFR